MAWWSDSEPQEAKDPLCDQSEEKPLTNHDDDNEGGKQPGTILATFQHELDKGVRGHGCLGEVRTIKTCHSKGRLPLLQGDGPEERRGRRRGWMKGKKLMYSG